MKKVIKRQPKFKIGDRIEYLESRFENDYGTVMEVIEDPTLDEEPLYRISFDNGKEDLKEDGTPDTYYECQMKPLDDVKPNTEVLLALICLANCPSILM